MDEFVESVALPLASTAFLCFLCFLVVVVSPFGSVVLVVLVALCVVSVEAAPDCALLPDCEAASLD